jgi:hypothetical protein
MTPDEIAFTNAFNTQRATLAGFSTCQSLEELQVVRDGVYLGLAQELALPQYLIVQDDIVTNVQVAETAGTAEGFASLIQVARQSHGWHDLCLAVDAKAQAVGSDLSGIWKTLEQGRLEWLQAASAAHTMKVLLQKGLSQAEQDNEVPSPSLDGDVSDAKMIWIYCLALNISELQGAAETWAKTVVALDDNTKPLVGYTAILWDSRKAEWRPLDVGVQAAAERGGSTLEEAWNAK